MKNLELIVTIVFQIFLIEAHRTRSRENDVLKCNQSISSRDSKNGTIVSPHYPKPYPAGIICQYEFHAEGQERIQLKFTNMDLYLSSGDPDDPFECPSQDSITVFIYSGDKEVELGQYCGKKHPQQLMSSGQRMKVLFNSESSQKDSNSGFRIEYSFRTDFGIQGNGVQDKREVCTFMFRSTLHSSGYFTSPNYGGQYPRNTMCRYIFSGRINELVEIEFPEFDVDGIIPRCDDPTDSDFVTFSNFVDSEDRQMGRYCGNRPSYDPVKSDAAFFRVTFKSNDKYDANGFKGIYTFKKLKEPEYNYKEGSRSVSSGVTGRQGFNEGSLSVSSSVTERQAVNEGSRSQADVIVSIATIILLSKSVIDHLLSVF